jgi:hypothetical protein
MTQKLLQSSDNSFSLQNQADDKFVCFMDVGQVFEIEKNVI